MAVTALQPELSQMPEIVVSVGTDHHRFDRLVRWTDDYARRHRERSILIQRGTSSPSTEAECRELIPHDELRAMFGAASVVICHGGPSTVMDARAAGRLPIVVPRNPDLGEHVDGHQVRFAKHLAEEGMAVVAWTESELFEAIDDALADPESVTIPIEKRVVPNGVINFGRVVDDLLGVETPIAQPGAKERFTKRFGRS